MYGRWAAALEFHDAVDPIAQLFEPELQPARLPPEPEPRPGPTEEEKRRRAYAELFGPEEREAAAYAELWGAEEKEAAEAEPVEPEPTAATADTLFSDDEAEAVALVPGPLLAASEVVQTVVEVGGVPIAECKPDSLFDEDNNEAVEETPLPPAEALPPGHGKALVLVRPDTLFEDDDFSDFSSSNDEFSDSDDRSVHTVLGISRNQSVHCPFSRPLDSPRPDMPLSFEAAETDGAEGGPAAWTPLGEKGQELNATARLV